MKKQNKISLTTNYILPATLFLVAFSERVFFDLGANFELVTTTLVLSSFYVGKKESLWIVFLIMFLSDLIIGNTNIFLFTWTGFLIPALVLPKFFRNSKLEIRNSFLRTLALTGTGLLSNLFFYIHTNLGVWLLSGMYPKIASGLLMSYINALPFFRNQLNSTMVFIPLGVFITEATLYVVRKYKPNIKSSPLIHLPKQYLR